MKLFFLENQKTALNPHLIWITTTLINIPITSIWGIILDSKLDFKFHVDQKIIKYNKLSLIRRLSVNVPRKALLTIYKSFIRPNLDYGDTLYDKPENQNFHN